MNIVELKEQIQKTLLEYLDSKPKKEYMMYNVCHPDTEEYFNSIARNKGRHGGWVYVITSKEQKQVKIGYTERNPVQRTKEVFPGSEVYINAFLCLHNKAYLTESYIQRILYSTGLQSKRKELGGIKAHSGGSEIFDIKPRIACALIDEAVTGYVFT